MNYVAVDRLRWGVITGLLASMLVVVAVALISAPPSDAARSTARCGYSGTSNDRRGIYIVRGPMSCAEVKRYLRRLSQAYRDGTTTSIDNNVSFYQGYYCGGRMGYYFCENTRPGGKRSSRLFKERSCSPQTPGCPSRITS